MSGKNESNLSLQSFWRKIRWMSRTRPLHISRYGWRDAIYLKASAPGFCPIRDGARPRTRSSNAVTYIRSISQLYPFLFFFVGGGGLLFASGTTVQFGLVEELKLD